MDDWKDNFVKAGLTAAVASIGAAVLFGENGEVPLAGFNIPSWALIGGSCAGASISADIAHQYVLPHLNSNSKLFNIESTALAVGSGGVASTLILKAAGMPNEGFINAFALGAVSVVGGDYLSSKVVGKQNLLF